MVDAMCIGIDDKSVDPAYSLAVRVDHLEIVEADHRVVHVSRIEITES